MVAIRRWSLVVCGLMVSACSADPGTPVSGGASATGGGTGTGSATGGSGGAQGGAASPTGGTSASGGGASPGTRAGGTGASPGAGVTLTASETWSDGKALPGSVTIAKGVTVTIAPGAKVSVPAGALITVLGTLTATAGATRGQLTGTWTGIVVGSGGAVTLDGVDISGAATAFATQAGAAPSSYSNGTLTAAVPFSIAAGTTLSFSHAVVTAQQEADVNGTFKASYLDYTRGNSEGIVATDPSATMDIADSTFNGPNEIAGDFIVSRQGTLVKVAYSTISGSHCAFHFDSVGTFTIDHVTVKGNAYGSMLWGSGNGPNTITASNFYGSTFAIDLANKNGPITIDGTYLSGPTQYTSQVPPKITNPVTAGPIANAKPH